MKKTIKKMNLAQPEKTKNKKNCSENNMVFLPKKKIVLKRTIKKWKKTKILPKKKILPFLSWLSQKKQKIKTKKQTGVHWLAPGQNLALFFFNQKKKTLFHSQEKMKNKILKIKKPTGKKRRITPVKDLGLPRHFQSATKEWYNSIYTYNRHEMRSIRGLDLSVSKLIKTYFTSIPNYFFDRKKRKRMIRKKWQLLTNKVYLSKSELKHTSSKVTITLYLFAERYINLTYIYKYLNKDHMKLSMIKNSGLLTFHNLCEDYPHLTDDPEFIKEMRRNLDKFILRFKKYLKLEKKLGYMFNFLENKISKFYKKKVEIKIIRLKYLYLNNNMLAEYIALKLISKKRNLFRAKRKIFKKIKFPYINKYDLNKITLARKRIILKSFRNEWHGIRGKHIWDEWKKNKYFRPEVMDDHSRINDSYRDFLDYLNYKFPVGIRLGIAGRLTRRNVAARTIKKYTYIGSIKNIDSSFRGLSVSNLRGCIRPNLEFTKIHSLARTGAFTVRSWLSKY